MFSGNVLRKSLLLLALGVLIPLSLVLGKVFQGVPADGIPPSSVLEETLFESNQYTQPDDETVSPSFLDVPASFELVGVGTHLSLYAERPSGAIRIVDDGGYVYGSSFAAAGDPLDDFNSTWEGIINSACVVEYYVYTTTGAYQIKEESFFTDPRTVLSFRLIEDGYELTAVYGASGIGLTLRVFLENDRLRVEIPADSITETATNPLRSVKVFPFLGAVYGNTVPGYVFVPDGSGALIRFKDVNVVTDIYEFPYYGSDAGISRSAETVSSFHFPVTGMILGIRQHGFVQIIDEGDAFATLVVSPAKNNLKYNYSYNKFIYRNLYLAPTSQSGAASGAGQQVIEPIRNSCEVSLVYDFLSGAAADYVGMANAYQDHLRSQGVLDNIETAVTPPMLVELLGAERAEGFLWDEVRTMTTFAQAETILSDLQEFLPAMRVVYKGWSQGGFSGAGLDYARPESTLGTRKELLSLLERYDTGTSTLRLYADLATVGASGRHNPYRDVSQRIDSSLASFPGLTETGYSVAPRRTAALLADLALRMEEWGAEGMALGSIGYRLFSDYKETQDPLDRAEVIALYRQALSSLGVKTAIYRANAYLLAYTDQYLAVPTTHSGYQIYTDSVPFVSILLAGTMEMFGPYVNFFANRVAETLRLVDYGLLPSVILTEASAYLLNDTELGGLYSSSYSTWKPVIAEMWNTMDPALRATFGKRVVSRMVPLPGVVRTVYADGTEIIVNYTGTDYITGLLSVAAADYGVVSPDA
ncbi:MAG TPA: DUF5696 domain-containing protein [Candidatus Izemoplasmatales bacterium]|nr:DUF5696 domain-containing protein [Candidatus Izemoplasmatales bacterium]